MGKHIALISDFFYPGKGGVETHIRTIGEELYKLDHLVVVITHKYITIHEVFEGRMKIGNLIVYYLDIPIIAKNETLPTMFTNYVLFQGIFQEHDIQIVHGHQSLSNLCLEGIYHASILNIQTVITDHSLFEMAKFERVLVNSLSRFLCKNVDWAICVSQVSKENTHLRIGIPLERISIIHNGILPCRFYPIVKQPRRIKRVIFMSRLFFRKGIDLLVEALPIICENKNLEILIVGDGPKKPELLQVIEENDLNSQVKIFDEINHEDVPDFLRTGDIFLNTSLTETFCLAILEAAACGLVVVSTNVGGIHEILGDRGILFCEPRAEDIAKQLDIASKMVDQHDPRKLHQFIASRYNWKTITKQIEALYYKIPKKTVNFRSVMLKFPGRSHFLCRLATFTEYLQVKLFNMLGFQKV